MLPLVSIITPCYNHAKYLDDYFNGLLSQTYRNIEIIIIDDHSSDASWEIIQTYQERLKKAFPRVICKRNQENIGLIRMYQLLQQHVTGDFVCILESDDYYKPTKVEENIKYFQLHPEMGVVHSDIDFVSDGRVENSHWATLGRDIPIGHVYERLLHDNFILTCSFCCRGYPFLQQIDFQKYASLGYLTADYPMFLDLARHTQVGYIDDSLACYRIVNNSISHPISLKKEFLWKKSYYQTKLNYIEEYGASDKVIRRANKQYYSTLFKYGYYLYLPDEFDQGYRWLLAHYPEEYNVVQQRIREFSMQNNWLWRVVKWLDDFEFFATKNYFWK